MTRLTPEQIEQFNRQGYLVVENVLQENDIEPIRTEYADILDREAPRLVAAGKLSQTYGDLPFEERYTKILGEMDDMYAFYQHLDISLPLIRDMPADANLNAGPAVFNHLLTNPKILDIAESILGTSELYSNPVQHTRIKPPAKALPDTALDSNVAKTWWHQDEAVLTEDATETNILTMWVAFTDATVNSGCMKCVEGSHVQDMTLHCPGSNFSAAEIFIPEAVIDQEKIVSLEVKKGGVVLLHQRTEHAAYDNNSDKIRWSFDLRYHPIGHNTGRDIFPGFVARSAENPAQALRDPDAWAKLWYDTRDLIVAGKHVEFNARWEQFKDHQLCA